MPLPKPNTDESHDDWMSRCMGNDTMNEEYPDDDQRYAVCQSIWDDKDESKGANMGQPQIERRVFAAEDAELRVSDDKEPTITGYAARFNKWSEDLGGFRERIAVGAFDDVLGDDVRCLRNHDPNLLLGRTPKTLELSANKTGLKYTNTPPNTVTGRETLESIRRGDISGNSFAFIVGADEWHEDTEGRVTRTIVKIDRLYDVGPVTFPAYPDTSVAVRSLEAWKATREDGAVDEVVPDTPVDEPSTKPGADTEPETDAANEEPVSEENSNEPKSCTEILADAEAEAKARARTKVDKQLGL